MSKSEKPVLDGKDLALRIKDFIETDLGEQYLTSLSLQYNVLHQRAEAEGLSMEQKAFLVERAAGLKTAITYLTSRAEQLDKGYYDEKKEDAA